MAKAKPTVPSFDLPSARKGEDEITRNWRGLILDLRNVSDSVEEDEQTAKKRREYETQYRVTETLPGLDEDARASILATISGKLSQLRPSADMEACNRIAARLEAILPMIKAGMLPAKASFRKAKADKAAASE